MYSVFYGKGRQKFESLQAAIEWGEYIARTLNRGVLLQQYVNGRVETIADFGQGKWRPPVGTPQPKPERAARVRKIPFIEGYSQ